MKTFKEIAEDLQKQAETFGIKSADIRILFTELILEVSAIMHDQEEHDAGICLFEAFAHLRTLKNKQNED